MMIEGMITAEEVEMTEEAEAVVKEEAVAAEAREEVAEDKSSMKNRKYK